MRLSGQNKLEHVLKQIPQGITIQDTSGNFLYANDRAAQMIGFKSTSELVQTSPQKILKRFVLFNESGQRLTNDELPGRRVLKTKRQEEAIIRFRAGDSSTDRWSYVISKPFTNGTGELIGVVNTFQDLTRYKRSEEALRILDEVGTVLSSSVNYHTRLKQLARLVVPKVADWCAIDMLNNDHLEREVVVHPDKRKMHYAQILMKKYPDSPKDTYGVWQAIKTGKTQIYHFISDALLKGGAKSAEHFRLLQKLSINSAVIIPLISRGETLGAITFVTSRESGRVYDQFDLVLLENLAQRAALLVDNSRLYTLAHQEVKKQRQIQKDLTKSEKNLKLALEVGGMAIGALDSQIKMFHVLHDDLQIFTSGNTDYSFEVFLKRVHPDDRLRIRKGLLDAVKSKKQYEMECRLHTANGYPRWVMLKGDMVMGEVGKPARILIVAIDITRHKESETALIQNEKKFRSIFDTALDAVIITNDLMNILDVNHAACDLFLMNKAQMVKKRLPELVSGDTRTDFHKRWMAFQHKGYQRGELEIIHANGDGRFVEYNATAQFLENRNLLVLRDITERKLEESRREHFLGIASHELKSPLASIKAFIQIIEKSLKGMGNSKLLGYFQKIDEKVDTLTRFINDLLDVTRIRHGKLQFFYEAVRFDLFLKEVVEELQFTIPTHKLRLKGTTYKAIILDKSRIAQVITNLVRNAVKFSPQETNVVIQSRVKDKTITVSIQDFGIGISAEEQKQVFELYYRGKNKEKQTTGLGVGLFISKEVIRQHGGRLTISSAPGKGSTFTFSLPLREVK